MKLNEQSINTQVRFIVPVKKAGDTEFTIPVTILAIRDKFGRRDARIKPVHGTGETWVSQEALEDA